MKIFNEFVSVEISTHAAEIISFKKNNDEFDYIWKGDSKYWGNRNPILFPIVGNTYNKKYTLNGKEYAFKTNHGFLRNADFDLIYNDDKKIVLRFKYNEDTFSQYPFKFEIDVIYKLNRKRLDIVYEIKNFDDLDMPFNFGLHPAFNIDVNNSYIEFSNKENSKNIIGDYMLDGKIINLNYDIFESNPTILFENLNSSKVKLSNGLNIGIVGYKWFAIWTKKDFPFICLEPWNSHGDFEEVETDFSKREGTLILKSKRSYTTSYYIEID